MVQAAGAARQHDGAPSSSSTVVMSSARRVWRNVAGQQVPLAEQRLDGGALTWTVAGASPQHGGAGFGDDAAEHHLLRGSANSALTRNAPSCGLISSGGRQMAYHEEFAVIGSRSFGQRACSGLPREMPVRHDLSKAGVPGRAARPPQMW